MLHVEVDTVERVPVIPAVGLADVPEGRLEVELAVERAPVVPGNERRADAELHHHAAARVPVVEVPSEAHEGEGDFVISREGRRADDRVVDGHGLRRRVVDVDEELGREERRVQHGLVHAARAVDPAEVPESERLGGLLLLGRLRRCGRPFLGTGRDAPPRRAAMTVSS